jgi:hypothetical protein
MPLPSAGAGPAAMPPPTPKVRIFVGTHDAMVDVSTLQDDLVSCMLLAATRAAPAPALQAAATPTGARDDAADAAEAEAEAQAQQRLRTARTTRSDDMFELGIAIHTPDGATSQMRLRLLYNPFQNGEASKPRALDTRNVSAAHVIMLRCGRMLTDDLKPAAFRVPMLRAMWGRDRTPARIKAAKEATRFLERVTGFLHLGAAAAPVKEKTTLQGSKLHAMALAALFAEQDGDMRAQLSAPIFKDVTFSSFMKYKREEGMEATPWGDGVDAVAVRDGILAWVHKQHYRDHEAGPSVPAGDHPLQLTVGSVSDCNLLRCGNALLTGWRGMSVVYTKLQTTEAAPLRMSLKLRTAGRQGNEAARLFTVRCFVTSGAPDDQANQATTAVAVMDPWDTPPEQRAVLLPLSGDKEVPVQDARSTTGFVLPMRLELRGAEVHSVADLRADGPKQATQLAEDEWLLKTHEAEQRKPRRVASVPQFHRGGARNVLVDNMPLEPVEELPSVWCIAVLKAVSNPKLEGRNQLAGDVYTKKVKITLTISSVDDDGVVAAGPPLETVAASGPSLAQRGATDEALRKFGDAGRGLHFFEPRTIKSLRQPGLYRLTFTADDPGDAASMAGVEALTLTLRRKAPELRRALDADAIWSVCCHAGRCDGDECSRRKAALQGGACSAVLGGPAMPLQLFVRQQMPDGSTVGFPDVLTMVDNLKLSIWEDREDEQRPVLSLKLVDLRAADMKLSDGDRELIISNVRMRGQKLPTGDALDPLNVEEQEKHGRACDFRALLRIGVASAHKRSSGVGSARKKKTDEVFVGGCELPIRVQPGEAKRIVFLPDDDSWCEQDEQHDPGTVLDVRPAVVDESGNATARLPAGASGLKMELVGMERTRRTREAAAELPLRPSGSLAGAADRVSLRVTAAFGSPYSVAFSAAPFVRAKATLSGSTPGRVLRIVRAAAAPALRGEPGAQLAALCASWAHVCAPDAVEPDKDFEGKLTLRAAAGSPAEWAENMESVDVIVTAGKARLPAITLPSVAGTFHIVALLEHAQPSDAVHITVEVIAAAVASLYALPVEGEPRVGVPLRLTFTALSATGAPTAVTAALLNALEPSGTEAAAMKITRREPRGVNGATITMMVTGASRTTELRLTAAAAPAGGRELHVSWHVSLEAGPPASAQATQCAVLQGEALENAAVTLFDDLDNVCGKACDDMVVTLDAVPWLLSSTFRWAVRDGVASLDGVRVARDAPVGMHEINGQLLAASVPRERRPRVLLPFSMQLAVVAGRHARTLLLASSPGLPLQVEAGARIAGIGAVSALDALGQPVAATGALASLVLLLLTPGQVPTDPRLQRDAVLVAPSPGVDGGGYDCDAAAAVMAKTVAGTYVLHFLLRDADTDGAAPVVAVRTVQVVAAVSGPLECSFVTPSAAPLPPCIKATAATAADASGGVFAAQLGVRFTDAHGNPFDLTPRLTPGTVQLRFERASADAAAAAAAPPLVQPPPGARNRASDDALQSGIVAFWDVRAAASWPSGRYRVVADVHADKWRLPPSGFAVTAAHCFTYISPADTLEEQERQLRLSAARDASEAAVKAVRDATKAEDIANGAKRAASDKHAQAGAAVRRLRELARNSNPAAVRDAETLIASARDEEVPKLLPPAAGPSTPLHVAEYSRRHRSGGMVGHAPAGAGPESGLGASFADGNDVICQFWELIRAGDAGVRDALCRAAGSGGLGIMVVRSDIGEARCDQRLSSTLSTMKTHKPSVQRLFYTGGIQEGPQQLLGLDPSPLAEPGCLGYLVNLVHLTERQLAARVVVPAVVPAGGAAAALRGRLTPPGTPGPTKLLSMRASVLYHVYGRRLLFDTDDNVAAFERRHPDAPSRFGGLRSISGRNVTSNGLVHGVTASAAPSFFKPPGVPLLERDPVRFLASECAAACLSPLTLPRPCARAQAMLTPKLRAALALVKTADTAAAQLDTANEDKRLAEADEHAANAEHAKLRRELTDRQAEAQRARAAYDALLADMVAHGAAPSPGSQLRPARSSGRKR